MKTIMDKGKVIETLRKNRETHRGIFLKAIAKFQEVALRHFQEQIEKIKANKMPQTFWHVTTPTDQTREYDRAISMLEAHTGDTVEMGQEDYTQFILDRWGWTEQWKNSSKPYTHVPDDD